MRPHESLRASRERRGRVVTVSFPQAQIDPMYQYSLQYYQALFNLCLKNSEPCEDQARRLEIIIKYSTENCYANICRGLFEKDKTLYSALLVFNILRHADKIPAKEWGLFVRGPGLRGNQIYFFLTFVWYHTVPYFWPYAKKKFWNTKPSTRHLARWRGGSRRSTQYFSG